MLGELDGNIKDRVVPGSISKRGEEGDGDNEQ